MAAQARVRGRLISGLVVVAVVLAPGALAPVPAVAAPAPVVASTADTVSADRLPTTQVDGVVWSTAVVGNTVFAGGKFNNARPAGAAPGTNLTPRGNLLAFDIRSGELITAFAPTVSAQILSVAASPDGTRLYVVGDFTTANGQARRRVAAFSTATGALVTTFNPAGVSSQARAVVATNDAVYVGGGFASAGTGQARNNLAAFRASDGALLPWNPNADYTVWALAVTADGSTVFAGGSFQNVGGQAAYGLAKISATTGVLDTTWKPSVRSAGPDAGISSLRVQGTSVYGTAWHFGPGGNLEGTFKVPVSSSDVEWVTDCHGDNYSSFMVNGIVYAAGHAHYCGNMGGGFPQYPTWRYQHAQAWTDTAAGEILNDVHGYPNWHGREPGPSIVNWLPNMGIGSFTGQYQAGWSVTGTSDYVVYGGEFPTVNSVGQQGLVRFGRRSLAPNREGPNFVGGTAVPRLVPTGTGSLRVTWPAGYDRDDASLTYQVVRDGAFSAPRHSTVARSNWWTLPALGFVDTELTPGRTYRYQIVAKDPHGNTVNGASASITMPTSFPAPTGFAQAVRNAGARIYWPLDEASGDTVTDRATVSPSSTSGVNDAVAGSTVTRNQPGAVTGNAAIALSESDTSRVAESGTETAPDTFTTQVWLRTTTTRGGRVLGFGDLQTGTSGHRDRHLYMDNAGRLVFGVRDQAGALRTITSPLPYNNGQWHLVNTRMGPAGMALYVDGVEVAQRATTTQGEAYLGYWRLGGDNLDGWPVRPTTRNFAGSVDEVAVYPTALTASQIGALYAARNTTAPANRAPTAAFSWSAAGLTVGFDGTASSDTDGTIAAYAWTFGDGTTATGSRPSKTFAAGGTYGVSLRVTDDDGATHTTSHQVTVSEPASGVVASDAFSRTTTGGWGSADTGGAWTLGTSASNFSVQGGEGTMRMAAGSGPKATLGAVSVGDAESLVSFGYDKAGTGSGMYTSTALRRTGTSDYRAEVRSTASTTTLNLKRMVDGAETVLASQAVPGLVVGPGVVVNLKFQAQGSGTTTLRAKVWGGSAAEPATWNLVATDTTAALQGPGSAGVFTYLSGSATNAPIVLGVRDITVRRLP